MKTVGFHVAGFKRRIGSDETQKLTFSTDRVSDDLLDVLSVADFVVNILPNTAATKGLLTLDKLRACKAKQPVFINVGRGDVIKEWTPVLLTPHVAALSLPDEVANVFVKNLDLRLQEKPMLPCRLVQRILVGNEESTSTRVVRCSCRLV